MSLGQKLLEVIDDIYDASIDSSRWQGAVAGINGLIGSRCGVLHVTRGLEHITEIATGVDPAFLGTTAHLNDDNLWITRRHLAPIGRAVAMEALATSDEVKRSRMYQEVFREIDILHGCGIAIAEQNGNFGAMLFMRSEREGAFERQELNLLDTTAPHVMRAANISNLLARADCQVLGLETATDSLNFGLLLLDEQYRIVFANAIAEDVLGSGALTSGVSGGLTTSPANNVGKLRDFLDRLGHARDACSTRLTRSNQQVLSLIGLRLPERRKETFSLHHNAKSVVFVFTETTTPAPARLMAGLFKLTPAEMALAEALAAGQTLTEYAERVGVSRNTLRTQLRSIFDKTDTKRQSELTRLLERFNVIRTDEI